ncbi:hypothetical protein CQY20_09290 [Mycolicibacterium agri]|uniref:Tyrosinase copper-binding domain-containing protein n=2 Tax=Mycolicibacterium agri TaxID=36811 RepID=A0A2A7N7N2_MYCAG|nr:hypothetical protein CQY20_09290 [Mycolicibacterium agri]
MRWLSNAAAAESAGGEMGIDAALYSNSKCYFFAGDQYIRVSRGDLGPGTVDAGYPKNISGWGWGAFGQNVPTVRTRRNIFSLESENPGDPWHPVILAYARAVAVLRQRSVADVNDPTGWIYQAQVHGVSPDPGDGFRNKCQHFGWFFLPWHRMYIYQFESIVKSVVAGLPDVDDVTKANWALPYWDYTKGEDSRRLPVTFRSTTLPNGDPNPLFDASRSVLVNNGAAVTELIDTDYRTALRPLTFTGATAFGGAQTGENHRFEDPNAAGGPLEMSPHGTVHTQVGGNMAAFETAALDPIFWLHHANIDRIWDVWRRLGNGRGNPTLNLWLNAIRFGFHDASGAEVRMTVDATLDSATQLGYVYEDLTGPVGPLGAEQMRPEPENPPQLVGATEEPVQLTGETADVSFELTPPAGPLEARPPARVYLRLEDITYDVRPGVTYAVYLNTPDDSDETPDDHYVGTASMFGVPRRADASADHPGMRLVFDITDLYERLREAGRWSDTATVRLVPIYLEEREGAGPHGAEVPGTEQEAGTVNIGQVGVYFQ